jgi:phospholipid/cholesterol/gamma-HCH transport system substrate-binding protein
MENRAHALAAGLFTLVLAAVLVATGLWFRKDDIRLARYVVSTTSSVAGLKVGAPVLYRGVDVGRVESIKIEPGVSGRINVRIGVQEGTPVTKSTYAQLGYQGVTGLAYVSLNDDGSSGETLKAADGELARIGLRPSIFDSGLEMVAAVSELLNKENRQLVQRALAGAKDFPSLVGDVRSAFASFGALSNKLDERSLAFDRMSASLEEVGSAARSFNDETLPRFNALVEQLNRDTRALDRVLNALDENPQSFVFGAPRRKPGPGEPGFSDAGR